ncbi:SDR family oxidoreductase [Formicincola oecophyllae]|uniref:SDR family oxidoreductase n=1 Tax=Formicincola oecophyllae TaxID=2558361 RepID=A0A4Y6U8X4_9PROT|nr:SDR family oxidoreductase [Formicincola oecophyllae]QDH12896.1 SDR family oxidoreductase [Formicincola oecophyllae]
MSGKMFEGQKVLVTGASQGIGEATALWFAQQGARVAINGRKAAKLQEVLAKLPAVAAGPHAIVEADVGNAEAACAMVAETIKAFGGLDVLVANAGYQVQADSDKFEVKDFMGVLTVNVLGVVVPAREALRYWLANNIKGRIVVNSSVHQVIPKPGFIGYSASKGAVGNIVRTLALEYADRGIRVNAVGPGAIVTPINDAWVHDPKKSAAVCSHIPMGRAGTSEEIAGVIGFLAGKEADYITGQTIFVDGGLTLFPSFAHNWSS